MAEPNGHPRIRRLRQIASVLVRHGLPQVIDILGLRRFRPHKPSGDATKSEAASTPVHLRMALEELGVTFVKLGQVFSTRSDLLPPEYVAELKKLQDTVPAEPSEAMIAIIEAELGRSCDELFAHFDPVPLAAASIGQAYAATLHDGTEVVVKVRRPHAEEQVEIDLGIIQQLAATASRRWAPAREYDAAGLAQEFAETLRRELDYVREGRNAEQFAENFADDPNVHIPRVYWDLSTTRVLTLERIRGVRIDDPAALEAAGIDPHALAYRAADVELRMVFEHGFFHADPHPGNFFIEPGGRIGLIDFGMTGTIDEHTREQLTDVLLALTAADIDALVDTLFELGVAAPQARPQALRKELDRIYTHYYGRPLKEIALGPLLTEALAVIQGQHLRLPSNLALLTKTVIESEGLGARLDPDFHITEAIEPYARRLLWRQFAPRRLIRQLGRAGLDAARLGSELPRRTRRLLTELEHGRLEVGVRPEHFEPLITRLERLVNRVVLGVITAAFIVGLAILLSVYRLPAEQTWAAIMFGVGFVLACLLGGYLAWKITISGRG